MSRASVEGKWLEQLTFLALGASVKETKSIGGMILAKTGPSLFVKLASVGLPFSEDRVSITVPNDLWRDALKGPIPLEFPLTTLLSPARAFSRVLVASVGEGDHACGLIWVGRKSPAPYSDREIGALADYGRRLYQVMTPLLPALDGETDLRAWLSASLTARAAEWLEEGLTFILELLLSIGQTDHGFILLRGPDGGLQWAVTSGEGEKVSREPTGRGLLTLSSDWLTSRTAHERWIGEMGLKPKLSRRDEAVSALKVAEGVIRRLVIWSHNASWLESYVWRDHLTRVLTRHAFLVKLDQELNRASRYRYPVSILLGDLDGFKAVNDLLGHSAGDEVLKEIASRLTQSVRKYDLVGRYGGDEFVVALPATPLEGALVVAERVRRSVEEVRVINSSDVRLELGLSIGVTSTYDHQVADSSALIKLADEAALMAKARGKNRVEIVLPGGAGGGQAGIAPMRDMWTGFAQYVAHSINNPVSGILGLTELAQSEMSLPPKARQLLEQIGGLAIRLKDFGHWLSQASVSEMLKAAEVFHQRKDFTGSDSLPAGKES